MLRGWVFFVDTSVYYSFVFAGCKRDVTLGLTQVIMVDLCNRADHYIFILWFLSSFFSLHNLSGRRLDVYHTSAHGVVLV